MINRRKRILFTFLSGIVLLLVGGISSSYAQGTPVDFRGTWNTVTGKGKKIVITLETVRRTSVSGTYARNGLSASYKSIDDSVTAFVKVSAISGEPAPQSVSSIRGTVTDNVLRFKWFEDGGHGAGRFTMSSDLQSFQGTFSLTDNPDDTSGGTWNGTRAPIFHGVWQTTAGGKVQFPELLFQQSGSQVVGQLFGNRPDLGVIREGIIDGNTLRFKVMRPQPPMFNGQYLPDVPMGVGELVMNPDGKSFKGTILGAATSGTRLGGR
jgi:hypothetical protein